MSPRKPPQLSKRDIEILDALRAACDLRSNREVSPIDCGGFDGSDHSYRLTKLARLGYAKRRKITSRNAKYSIAPEGRWLLEQLRDAPKGELGEMADGC